MSDVPDELEFLVDPKVDKNKILFSPSAAKAVRKGLADGSLKLAPVILGDEWQSIDVVAPSVPLLRDKLEELDRAYALITANKNAIDFEGFEDIRDRIEMM